MIGAGASTLGWVAVLAVVALFVAVAGTYWYLGRKRTQAMRMAARSLRLKFLGDLPLPQLGALPLFDIGETRRAFNAMTGTHRGTELAIFDYTYVTHFGDSSTSHSRTVVWMRLPGADLPVFALKPEGIGDKLSALIGREDVDFRSHSVFSEAYWLRADDEAAVRRLFSARVLEAFERSRDELSVEGAGAHLIVYDLHCASDPASLRRLRDRSFAIAELLAGPLHAGSMSTTTGL
jgi:hypothetical protein